MEVKRLATISKEHLQKAKCLIFLNQKLLSNDRIERIKDDLSNKIETAKKKVSVKLLKNDECVKKSYSLLGKKYYHEKYLHELILNNFVQCNSPFLHIFIMVQNPAYNITTKLPKKGNLEDAKLDNDNLISIVYASRMVFNYIKADEE